MTTRRSLSITLPIDSPELLKRVGAAFFGEPYWEHWEQLKPPAPDPDPELTRYPCSRGNCLIRHEDYVLGRLRARLAKVLGKPYDHRFFEEQYLPGETPDQALMRLFRKRQRLYMSDEQTIEEMAKSK